MTLALLVVLGLSACSAPASPTTAPVPGDATPTPRPAPAATTGPATAPSPSPRTLSLRDLTWFGPLGPRADHMGFGGAVDYYDLFEPDADWATAADHIDVFLVYATWVNHYSTNDELRRVVDGAKARGLSLGLEIGGLRGDGCGDGVEGFDASLDPIRRIRAAGGTVRLVQFDEIYAFGHLFDGQNACRWPVERVASNAAEFVRELRGLVPDVLIGDVEPMWANVSAPDLGAWMDAYRDAAGEPFDFFHIDADWGLADWPERAIAATKEAQARGIPVGLIYNGGGVQSDAAWNDAAIDRIGTYEGMLGTRPEQVVFQSWFDRPDHALPESDRTTFTGLISAYFGARSTISVDAVQDDIPGALRVGGRIADVDGAPVPNATVLLTATPLDGPYQQLELAGVVPAGATSAVVALRVNEEGAGPGSADLTVYEVRYSEAAGTSNRVPNPEFSGGLDRWGAWGTGSVAVRRSDRGSGLMLRVTATPAQSSGLNSSEFKVTPGATYELSVGARIPAGSVGSTYLAVVFLAGSELARHRIDLAPRAIRLGDVRTDPSGRFQLSGADLEPGGYRLRLAYPGDATHWPVHVEHEVVVR